LLDSLLQETTMNSESFCKSIAPWFCCPEEVHLCEVSTTPVPVAIGFVEEGNSEDSGLNISLLIFGCVSGVSLLACSFTCYWKRQRIFESLRNSWQYITSFQLGPIFGRGQGANAQDVEGQMVQDPHRYDDVPGVGDADLRHPNIRHPVIELNAWGDNRFGRGSIFNADAQDENQIPNDSDNELDLIDLGVVQDHVPEVQEQSEVQEQNSDIGVQEQDRDSGVVEDEEVPAGVKTRSMRLAQQVSIQG